VGDQLLQQAASRIKSCIRQNDTVARLGGDEFTVILTEFEQITDIENIAHKMLKELASPFLIYGDEVNISGSIGISLVPKDATNPESLISCADQAMYEAKDKGRNQFRFFSSGTHLN
jgi:diguanylate cyclase (GGDEF)-like protein